MKSNLLEKWWYYWQKSSGVKKLWGKKAMHCLLFDVKKLADDGAWKWVTWHPVRWMTVGQGRDLQIWKTDIKPSCRKVIISRGACSRDLRTLPCGQEGKWKSQKYGEWIEKEVLMSWCQGNQSIFYLLDRRANQQCWLLHNNYAELRIIPTLIA